MIKKFEIDENSIANAPLKIWKWISLELQKNGYRADISGYRFISPVPATKAGSILSDIDIYAVGRNGNAALGRVDISKTVVNNQYVASKEIAESKELKLSATEKYALEVEIDGKNMHMTAKKLVEYIVNNF